MKKTKEKELPEKRGLTVDEIISKYPMTVRILLVQLVEQVERLQKKMPEVTEEWIEERARILKELCTYDEGLGGIEGYKNFIRSLVDGIIGK